MCNPFQNKVQKKHQPPHISVRRLGGKLSQIFSELQRWIEATGEESGARPSLDILQELNSFQDIFHECLEQVDPERLSESNAKLNHNYEYYFIII